MKSCHYCSTTILFGGVSDADLRFCSSRCCQSHRLLQLAERVSTSVVRTRVAEFHQGRCPVCGGPGPCDVHRTYKVWSAVFATHWSATPRVSCRSCATKSQLAGALSSFLLGWWGLPWGLIMTPVQIVRNLRAIVRGPNPAEPSLDLERLVRVGLAARTAKLPDPAAS